MLTRFIVNHFSKFVTRRDWRSMMANSYWRNYTDDLHINSETYRFNSTAEMIKYVNEDQEAEIYQKGIAQLLYNMGKTGIQDQSVYKRIERQLYKFKGEFPQRQAFGAYYGYIALSIDNLYMQEFLESEFKRTIEYLEWFEALEIIEACGKNTSLTRKYIFDTIKTYCEPLLLKEYPKSIKYSPGTSLKLFLSLINSKYFEPELFDPLVHDLVRQVKITKLEQWIEILAILDKLQNEGDYPRSLEEQINFLVDHLSSQSKYAWRYNFKERRYWNMLELKSRREEMPVQEIGYNIFNPPNIAEEYIKVKAKGNVEMIEREKKLQQEKLLDDLLYDEFMLEKMEKQAKSKSKLKGMKDEDDEIELDDEEKKDIMTDFQNKHYQNLKIEDIRPEDIPDGFFDVEEDDEYDDLEDKIEEATAKSLLQPKKKILKRRKGRQGKDDGQKVVAEQQQDNEPDIDIV